MDKTIYIKNITTQKQFHEVTRHLKSFFKFDSSYNLFTSTLPCEIMYHIDSYSLTLGKPDSFEKLDCFDVVQIFTANEFITLYNTYLRYKVEPIKPTPKFKVGDRVVINWGAFSIEDAYLYQIWVWQSGHRLVKESYIVEIGTANKEEYIVNLEFKNVLINEKYLSLKESKDRWSVGNYVEFLEDVYNFFKKGEFYEILDSIEEEPNSVGLKLIESSVKIKQTPINKASLDTYIYSGKIKWHENKPNIDSAEEGWKKLATGEFDLYALQDAADMLRRNKDYCLQTANEMYHEYKLSKPEITISKVKETHININKPKIN